MSITVNLYYTGENGNALKFAREMESSGTADAIRREEGSYRTKCVDENRFQALKIKG